MPYTIIIGRDRKVYYSMSGYDDALARAAINQAIADYDGLVYVSNPVTDQLSPLGGTINIDVSTVFDQYETEAVSVSIDNNSNPSVGSATLNGSILTLAASSFNPGSTTIRLKGTDIDNNISTDEFIFKVYNTTDVTVENFNDGGFTAPAYAWTTTNSGSGAKNWVTTTTAPQEGAYCAGTDAALKDGQWCAISASVNYTAAGSINFWKKTSSELGYDFLNFYIDGVLKGQWSGDVSWSQSSFSVTSSGSHTFKFEYKKDTAADGGTDQVWVDYIQFVTNSTPVTPPTPVLVSPSNGSSSTSGTPTFDWNDVTGSTLYDLLVDNNSDFSSPEVNVTAVPSIYTVPTKALSAGTYYWKVKVNSTGGSYSTPWTYTVQSASPPAVPANITTSLVSGNVYINWDDSANATSYDVYSSTTPYGTFSLLTNVTTSEYTYTGVASNGKIFFYIVAKN